MLIAVERLLVRVRQVPSRADELITLRGRLRAERRTRPGDEELEVAREIAALKAALAAALVATTACHSCAVGKRRPRGTFAGGDCCSGVTADLFDDDELAALAAAGTEPRDLRAPRAEHAGCAFRGARGCTLEPVHRPKRCVHYACGLLRRELRVRGELDEVERLLGELAARMSEFVELRRTRLADELIAPLEAGLGLRALVRA